MFGKKDNTQSDASEGLFRATREIAACFAENDLKHKTSRTGSGSYVETGFSGENVDSIKVLFISSDDDSDVAVRSVQIVSKIPEGKRSVVLQTVNELNSKFRYVKFVLDDDSVNAEYDIPQRTENVGSVASEILIRFVRIIDEAYPELMKALWS